MTVIFSAREIAEAAVEKEKEKRILCQCGRIEHR